MFSPGISCPMSYDEADYAGPEEDSADPLLYLEDPSLVPGLEEDKVAVQLSIFMAELFLNLASYKPNLIVPPKSLFVPFIIFRSLSHSLIRPITG